MIIQWGGYLSYGYWYNNRPEAESESWYSIIIEPMTWGVIVSVYLINWVLKKIFHKQAAKEENKISKAFEKVSNSTK